MKIIDNDLKKLVLISNLIIIFFYSFYLLNWEPTIVGVFREILIIPVFLLHFFLTLYTIFKLLTNKIKMDFYYMIHLVLTFLLVFSFIGNN
tara:strand:- start:1422 stop:1694 length:273 start_codon:yes stop_codon:yes gene_type:complete